MTKCLVIWDHNEKPEKLLEKARDLALPVKADIHLVAFISTSQRGDADLAAQVAASCSEILGADITVTQEIVETDDIAGWVTDTCIAGGYDLVIKTGHRSEKLFYTPTDWSLIRQLPCALLLASDHKWKSRANVLATVDAGSSDEKQLKINSAVLQGASQWAQYHSTELHVAYSIPIAKPLTELDIVHPSEVMNKKGERAKADLADCLQKNNISHDISHVSAGDPATEIPRIANSIKADLVVMGSVGRTGIKGLLLGNTAEKVLKNLRTDVLIIKPAE
ncbi:MAG: universal stress protein [Pseudomonadales bacterium]